MSDEPTLLYYDANGKRVSADDPSVARQFLSDDVNRPDAPEEAKAAEETKAKIGPTATKARTSPDETK